MAFAPTTTISNVGHKPPSLVAAAVRRPTGWTGPRADAIHNSRGCRPTPLFAGGIQDAVEWSKEKLLSPVAKILLVALLLIPGIQVIDTGEIGIVSQLGQLTQIDPGLHFVAPLVSNVDVLTTKTTLLEQSNFVPTKEGLTVELDTAVLFRLQPEDGVALYGSVGAGYVDKLVTPEVSSAVRGLTSESEAKALYTSGRSEIQNKLKGELSASLNPRGVVIEDVLLKAVVLPEDLSQSIEEKARAEQDSARMEFVLQKEKQEAERKAIEAEGIAEFQRIVSKGITPSLLQWKGIEATEKLTNSPNAKVVIMGNTKDSLPVILGNDK